MKILHFLFFIFCGIGILVVIGNIANIQACTSYENCVRTLPHSTTQTASFNGNHTTYGIPYNLSNATLVTSLLDLPARELIFEFNATDAAGQLMVELPRSIIDSTRGGDDKPYLIFVGDILSGTKRVKANEVQTTDTNRTLKINFTKNDNMIGIVGTYFIESNSTTKTRNGYGAWSPLQQYQKGFDAQDIVCKNEFILVIKTEDGSPACVKPLTASNLIKKGWAQPGITPSEKESHDVTPTVNTNTSNILKKIPDLSSSLQLFLSINPTTVHSGQSVGIGIFLKNMLSTSLIVPVKNDWAVKVTSLEPCITTPIGLSVLRGYYTEENMTEGKQLPFYNMDLYCPLISYNITNYQFAPMSNKAQNVDCISNSIISPACNVVISKYFTMKGYWERGNGFHIFESGNYTVIGADEWGHIAIQHFVVTNSTKR